MRGRAAARLLRLALLAGLLPGMAPAPAGAGETRLLDADAAAPYRSVGRLNIAGTRFCSATLIEPALVVTAAHCLFNPRTGARVPVGEFRFVAGLRRGEVAAVAQPVRAAVHPRFRFGAPTIASVGTDLALLELDAPVPAADVAPFDVGGPTPGPFSIVSYRKGRGQVATITSPCPAVARNGPVMTLACTVTQGISGAPVLDDTRLIAIVSAMATATDGSDLALTVLLAPAMETLRAALAAAPHE